ncbi:MAG: septal ring lytic transglycosylase RlpA family protein [Candidatus Gracilibacteria bacterium]|nr:septal ring lytic transglycosylase RlpA family protein [Candidatus Gracilibacteria bacterium]
MKKLLSLFVTSVIILSSALPTLASSRSELLDKRKRLMKLIQDTRGNSSRQERFRKQLETVMAELRGNTQDSKDSQSETAQIVTTTRKSLQPISLKQDESPETSSSSQTSTETQDSTQEAVPNAIISTPNAEGKRTLKPVRISRKKAEQSSEESVPVTLEPGIASYYADRFNGQHTSSGEVFDNSKLTAAHRTLPFGTQVRVRNKKNGNTVIVTINDRGPYAHNRLIDLSQAAFASLDSLSRGLLEVELEVIEE